VKRSIALGATTLLLTLAAAGPAGADPSTAPGPGACFGPPGQPSPFLGMSLVQFAKWQDMPPGQIVSFCNLHGHGGEGGS
jgi:hypothetical protein